MRRRLRDKHCFVPCGRIENVARKLGKTLALILMQKQLDQRTGYLCVKPEFLMRRRLRDKYCFVPSGRIENVARKLRKTFALILMQKQLD
jgi:L-amino acid N-acyltransferase YncA